MFGVISVLGSVGLICASGVVVSSALKFFHTYEFDVVAKIKESKSHNDKKEVGGVNHANHMENLSRKIKH